jgi:diguanylate cyclase (GGDEF)-like protein
MGLSWKRAAKQAWHVVCDLVLKGTRSANRLPAPQDGAVVIPANPQSAWRLTALATFCCTLASGSIAGLYDFLVDAPNTRDHIALAVLVPMLLTPLFAWFVILNMRNLERERAHSRALADTAERERRHLDTAVNNMPIGLVMFDATKRLIVGNEPYRTMYGLPHHVMTRGTHLRDMLACRLQAGSFEGTDREEYIERILKLVEQTETTRRVAELDDGRSVSIIHHPIEGGGWVGTHEDVTDRRKAEARIHHMARHDALTDLPNRNLFKEKVGEALQSAQKPVAVLCLDLDRFKHVNDTLGHPAGDALLRLVAARLKSIVRHCDTIARFGGDEFALAQLAADQPAAATKLAERIVETIGAPYDVDGHQVVIGASVGVALGPNDGTCSEELLKKADLALYRAKSEGRGRSRFFEPGMDALMQMRRALELDLREALQEGQFEVHYQPIVDIASSKVTCFEALLRWRHPRRGLLQPADFLALAEEIGLIVPLGAWVLRQACQDAVTWRSDIRVAVNVSPAQFRHAGLIDMVFQSLAASGLAPSRLELEITENVLLTEHTATLAIMHKLRGIGVRVVMDDFGTGHSSIGYLRSFPFDKIKIDRSFIASVSTDASSLAIIRAVAGLGGSLGIATTAEGVETEEALAGARLEGCTEVQGFLFGRATCVSEIANVLTSTSERSVNAA